ncbi:MAG: SIR2 family protein [Dechloromonas sp.]|nr:MAG: SIR2 family protein [Dechloromonas sp.]
MWPEALIRDIAAQRAVLFFGAGISMNSIGVDGVTRPKSWISFLNEATKSSVAIFPSLKKDIKALMAKNDLLTACEVIRRAIGRDDFVELVKKEFQIPGYKPAPIHDLLWKLDIRIAITPNFDNIYDALVAARGNGTVTVKRYFDSDVADSIRRKERVVIKAHGSVTDPDHLIFTRADYAKARSQYSRFYELLDALLRTHTFLFVGCGLDDPDIRLLLEDYCYRHPYSPQHYFVIPSKTLSAPVKGVVEESLRVKLLEYKATPDHANLTIELGKLVSAVENARIEMGKQLSW